MHIFCFSARILLPTELGRLSMHDLQYFSDLYSKRIIVLSDIIQLICQFVPSPQYPSSGCTTTTVRYFVINVFLQYNILLEERIHDDNKPPPVCEAGQVMSPDAAFIKLN